MPKADDMVYFKNCHKGLEAPFVIYPDFEAINEKYTDFYQIMINRIPNHIKSIKIADMAIRLSVVMIRSKRVQIYSKRVQIYRAENAVHKFMKKMLEVEWCKKMKYKHFNTDMILTK